MVAHFFLHGRCTLQIIWENRYYGENFACGGRFEAVGKVVMFELKLACKSDVSIFISVWESNTYLRALFLILNPAPFVVIDFSRFLLLLGRLLMFAAGIVSFSCIFLIIHSAVGSFLTFSTFMSSLS